MEYKYGKYKHITGEVDPISVIFEEMNVLKRNVEYAKRNYESIQRKLQRLEEDGFPNLSPKTYKDSLFKYKRSMEINQGNLDRYEHHLRILEDNGYLKENK
jgi:hypothetical protein